MTSFISIEVVNSTAGDYEDGIHVISKNVVVGVIQTDFDKIEILTDGGTPSDKVELTIGTSETGANVAPVMSSNLGTAAINKALLANPGGIVAKVFLPKDDNGNQIYCRNISFV
tara:strand:+ start:632 stop:973 length:342 start_codon:yes stop_codon:yes gene_type:complete